MSVSWPLPEEFSEGLAPIHTDPDGSRWGYIDTTGKLVFSLPTDYSIRLDVEGTFHEGIAIVSITAPSAGGVRDQLAWIDRAGHLLHLDMVGPIFWSLLRISRRVDEIPEPPIVGIQVDHSFQWVIPPHFHTAEDFQEGIALVSVADARLPNGWAYIDKTGKILFKDDGKYGASYPRSFSDGLAELEVDWSPGPVNFEFVDLTGQPAIGPTLGMARDFHEGYALAFVGDDGHLTLIDKHGRQTKLDGIWSECV